MSFKKLVSSSICTTLLCTVVSAQETKPNQGASPQQANANQGVGKMTSHALVTPQELASCWALDNQEQVALAKFAQEKTKNKEVSDFAKMIAEEHQSFLKKLSKFAPEASREGYLSVNQADQNRSSNDPNAATNRTSDQGNNAGKNGVTNQNASNSGRATSGINMMQLQREIAQQCITDSKKYLSMIEGDKFDKCFVGMQIAKHAAMHTKLVVLQRHTSDEMHQMVSEGIQSAEKHMKAAESLMAKLDKDESDTSSTKTGK